MVQELALYIQRQSKAYAAMHTLKNGAERWVIRRLQRYFMHENNKPLKKFSKSLENQMFSLASILFVSLAEENFPHAANNVVQSAINSVFIQAKGHTMKDISDGW